MSDEKSNIDILSNLMVKAKHAGGFGIFHQKDWERYAPAEVLVKFYPVMRDKRTHFMLSSEQREQMQRMLFLASEIVDID